MSEFLLGHEPLVRLSAFASVFTVMALWEVLAPRRRQAVTRARRWPSNLGIVALDTLFVRILFPTTAVGLALLAETKGWGLFHVLAAPELVAIVLGVVMLDLAVYLQHVLVHAVPALWRLHRMHHADLEFDVTTGARFHPIEIVLSMVLKMMVITALGAPAVAVLVFEVLLNATAMFNHGNVRLPEAVDRVLRLFMVTPDMHRVHHSVDPAETNTNYGFNLSVWDRMLGTYKAEARLGQEGMAIGIEQFRTRRDLWLNRMLIQPALGPASGHALDTRPNGPSSVDTR